MANILIGVTGGIAAYKIPTVARYFIKKGHSVKFMMTDEAEKFIGYKTLAAISGNAVLCSSVEFQSPIEHIALAKWADICLIAPATANTIGKYASGIADSMFLSSLLALKCPLVFAPSMNCNMYSHPAVTDNIQKIKNWGVYIIEPDEGELACGEEGKGRLKEPEKIADFVLGILNDKSDKTSISINSGHIKENTISSKVYDNTVKELIEEFDSSTIEEYLDNDDTNTENNTEDYGSENLLEGLKFIVTAGPTYEYIDPVRYISNRSSGKMGYAIAHAAQALGADVTLITGKTNLKSRINDTINIITCKDMAKILKERISECNILIMAAAVADYTPKTIALDKIKKESDIFSLELVKTEDILKSLSNMKKDNQIFIGFAAETENLNKNALKKLNEKNLDMIAANDVSRDDIGFDSDYNELKLFFKNGRVSETGRRTKKELAEIIVTEAAILAKGGE